MLLRELPVSGASFGRAETLNQKLDNLHYAQLAQWKSTTLRTWDICGGSNPSLGAYFQQVC